MNNSNDNDNDDNDNDDNDNDNDDNDNDDNECDECGAQETRPYEIRVEIPLTVIFQVEATDEEDAVNLAADEAREMRLTTFLHSIDAPMVGLTDKNGVPVRGVTFDFPEHVGLGDFQADEV